MPGLKHLQHDGRRHRKRAVEDLDLGVARALVELSRAIGSDWDSSIRRILKLDAGLLHVERANFWTMSDLTGSIHCDAGYIASLQSFEHGATLFESEVPEYFAALRTALVIDMHEVMTDPRCRGLREYCAARGVTSMLDVPVVVAGHLCGVLCHEHVGSPRRWTERDVELATSMGQVVASALLASAQTRAEATARRAAFLDAFVQGLSSLDAHEIAKRAVSTIVPGASASTVWVVNRDGALECLAFKHRDPAKQAIFAGYLDSPEGAHTPILSSATQRVMRQRQSLCIPDVHLMNLEEAGAGPGARAIIEKLAIRALFLAPLTVGGRTFGVMTFAVEHSPIDAGAQALAENIADRVAAALEMARLYQVAREAIRARDDLLELAAHELRTPLTALQLRAEHQLRVAESRGDPGETARSKAMLRDVQRFTALTDHMVDALNIRAQGIALAQSPCDLAVLVRHAVARYGTRARAAGSTLSVDCAPSITGRWDQEQLRKVIDILLDNAIKFGKGAPIAVSAKADGAAELTIRDQGIGIADHLVSAIFDPFGRAVSKEHFGGLGLGLFTARAIVEAHGGSLTVTSRPGEGSTFLVRLPRSSEGRTTASM